MLDSLVGLAGPLGRWGYLVILLVIALECQVLLGLVLPGESLVLVGGFVAAQGLLNRDVLILVIFVAAVVGDSVGYELGRRLGLGWLLKHGARFGVRQKHLERVDGFFVHYGGVAAFGSHFLHLLRAVVPFVAGARRMHYLKFLLFNAVGCMVWAAAFVLLGYLAGESWRIAAKWAGGTGEIVVGAVLLAVALRWLWRWFARHQSGVKRRWQVVRNARCVTVMGRGLDPGSSLSSRCSRTRPTSATQVRSSNVRPGS